MAYFKKLEADDIYLSPPDPDDAPIYAEWMNHMDITEKLGNAIHVISEAGERVWLEEDASEYQFAIVRKNDDTLIGNCGIENIDFPRRRASIGIFIGNQEDRGKGYGEQVVRLLLEYGFEYLDLNNIMLCLWSFNEQAYHCYQKVGFQEFGRRRETYYLKGKYYDEIYMDILKREWFAEKEK